MSKVNTFCIPSLVPVAAANQQLHFQTALQLL